MEKVSNYAFLVTAICSLFLYALMQQLKLVLENNQVAENLSLAMISLNVIWNFCYFSIYFEIAMQKPVSFIYAPLFLLSS